MELIELTTLVDQYTTKREQRLAADKHAQALKDEELLLKERVIEELIKNECGMVGGTYKKVTLQTKRKPTVADWASLQEYIMENGALELLWRRLNEGALKERLEANEEIPGIEFFEINDLSVSKL